MSAMMSLLISVIAAIFFMAATWGMKALSGYPVWMALPVIFILLGLGALAEMEVLRATRMGHVAVVMLAVELVLSFGVACTVLGERYTLQEMAGVAVIVAGMALLSFGGQPQHTADANGPAGNEPRLTALQAGPVQA